MLIAALLLLFFLPGPWTALFFVLAVVRVMSNRQPVRRKR